MRMPNVKVPLRLFQSRRFASPTIVPSNVSTTRRRSWSGGCFASRSMLSFSVSGDSSGLMVPSERRIASLSCSSARSTSTSPTENARNRILSPCQKHPKGGSLSLMSSYLLHLRTRRGSARGIAFVLWSSSFHAGLGSGGTMPGR